MEGAPPPERKRGTPRRGYNPIAPGDLVEVVRDPLNPTEGLITEIRERTTSLTRWNKKGRAPQVLAANADLAVCVSSPRISSVSAAFHRQADRRRGGRRARAGGRAQQGGPAVPSGHRRRGSSTTRAWGTWCIPVRREDGPGRRRARGGPSRKDRGIRRPVGRGQVLPAQRVVAGPRPQGGWPVAEARQGQPHDELLLPARSRRPACESSTPRVSGSWSWPTSCPRRSAFTSGTSLPFMRGCEYQPCLHAGEPGCAVLAAVERRGDPPRSLRELPADCPRAAGVREADPWMNMPCALLEFPRVIAEAGGAVRQPHGSGSPAPAGGS